MALSSALKCLCCWIKGFFGLSQELYVWKSTPSQRVAKPKTFWGRVKSIRSLRGSYWIESNTTFANLQCDYISKCTEVSSWTIGFLDGPRFHRTGHSLLGCERSYGRESAGVFQGRVKNVWQSPVQWVSVYMAEPKAFWTEPMSSGMATCLFGWRRARWEIGTPDHPLKRQTYKPLGSRSGSVLVVSCCGRGADGGSET